MTGDVVKAMRHRPQPVIAAVEGVCAGAGAILAMASDLQAQAELMLTKDIHRAYEAFAARRKPLFEGD